MSKKQQKTTTSKSKSKLKPEPVGWGIDQAKYDAARKKTPPVPEQKPADSPETEQPSV